MSRALLIPALAAAATLAACTPTLGPPPPGGMSPSSSSSAFRAADFAWSEAAGSGAVSGRLVYRQGATRFTCSGSSVVLTPETPWTRQRMMILYQSGQHAALPVDDVRSRTAAAPSGDPSAFVRRTTCDAADRFTFTGLPDGAWYAITTAKPASGAGPTIAVMRRVVTRGGRTANAEL